MVVVGASNRVVCDHGGVCSEGNANFAFTGIRSREGFDIVHPSVSIDEHDSIGVKVVGDCESAEKYGRVIGVNSEGAPSTTVLGLAGAAAAPVMGSAHGGARKVKSVNTLVEALGSPAQKRVIAAARSRRGRERPAKVSRVEEAGGVVANESLSNSDIQARQRYLHSEAEATLKLGNLIGCVLRAANMTSSRISLVLSSRESIEMRLLSWNVRSFSGVAKCRGLFESLSRNMCDMVLLQESKWEIVSRQFLLLRGRWLQEGLECMIVSVYALLRAVFVVSSCVVNYGVRSGRLSLIKKAAMGKHVYEITRMAFKDNMVIEKGVDPYGSNINSIPSFEITENPFRRVTRIVTVK
ncbi:hypothetical protein GQ457_15G014990 [Hibiscus cannabinus]